MNKTAGRILSAILVVCIIISACITFGISSAAAVNGSLNDNSIRWSLNDDGVFTVNGNGYGTDLADWYPGSRYCDIVGADSYEAAQNGAEGRLYNPVLSATYGAKPLTMHETGLIPSTAELENVPWVYFMTWHTTYLTEDNSAQALSEIYNSDYVITLDELPQLYQEIK